MKKYFVTLILLALAVGGFAADDKAAVNPKEFIGKWRVFSQRLCYDQGGAGAVESASFGTAVTERLELNADGKWTFGQSHGEWSVAPIDEADWKRWGIKPYGPTRKVVFNNWKGAKADGPVEQSTKVNFLWLLYRVAPPLVQAPGTVNAKFGHAE